MCVCHVRRHPVHRVATQSPAPAPPWHPHRAVHHLSSPTPFSNSVPTLPTCASAPSQGVKKSKVF